MAVVKWSVPKSGYILVRPLIGKLTRENYYLYIFTKFCEESMLPLSTKRQLRKRLCMIMTSH